jgi:hypothetical protein
MSLKAAAAATTTTASAIVLNIAMQRLLAV